jgi:phosphatidate cytidylyltransferase
MASCALAFAASSPLLFRAPSFASPRSQPLSASPRIHRARAVRVSVGSPVPESSEPAVSAAPNVPIVPATPDGPSRAAQSKAKRSVQRRVATGFTMGAVVIGVIFTGRWLFALMMLVAQLLGQGEYYRMVIAKGHSPAFKTGLLVTATLIVATYFTPSLADAVFPIGGTAICIYLLFRRKKAATIADISTTFMGLFYAGYLPSFWVRLHGANVLASGAVATPLAGIISRLWPKCLLAFAPAPVLALGPMLVFWTWLSTASADIGAFFVGRTLGRTRISSISPKKTLEGAMAGFLCSASVSMLGAFLLRWPFWQVTGALYGVTVGVIGLFGDLFASSFKRDVGWKDSGSLFPGHGGILDRADSYVLVAPLVYYFATLVLPLLGYS